MMILDGAVPEQRQQWSDLWQSWPDREVFAHPDYVRLFARPEDRVLCAAWQTAEGGVLFPFIMRPLAGEPWAPSGEPAWDIISPYGYGGAFAWNTADEDTRSFWSQFESWCKSAGVVSSFVRLSLFPEQILPYPGNVELKQQNVVRSLDLDPDALWRNYDHKVRKNVNRARQAGLTTEIDLTGQRLEEFLAIYHATMDRREASAIYFFPRTFFETIASQLAGQFVFFHVFDHATMVSTELVLVSARHMYSTLGGTLPEAFPKRANDLLKHEAIGWGSQAGKRAYVLGGGYGGEDGIYRYKKAFAPEGSVPFYAGTKIHDEHAYARLVEQRRQYEQQRGNAWQPKAGWFPDYRA
jgi:hypothetical protein